jgi:hypothetical protein
VACLHEAAAQADDGENKRDLQAYREYGQKRPDGPVLQVLDNEFCDQCSLLKDACGARGVT